MNRKLRKRAAAAARQMNASTEPAAVWQPQAPLAQTTENTALEDLRRSYYEKFRPADAVECDLVEQMINAQWRQQTLALIEQTALPAFCRFRQTTSPPPLKSKPSSWPPSIACARATRSSSAAPSPP